MARADEDHAPLAVVGIVLGEGAALVSWVEASPADAFRVYGIAPDGGAVLLQEVDPTAGALVPGGYADYGVSAVKDDVESRIVLASGAGSAIGCVHVTYPPPNVGYDLRCIDDIIEDTP